MREPAQRYRQGIKDLLAKRLTGTADENKASEDLDQAWFEMTPEERVEAEAWCDSTAPINTDLVDREVDVGDRRPPRIFVTALMIGNAAL